MIPNFCKVCLARLEKSGEICDKDSCIKSMRNIVTIQAMRVSEERREQRKREVWLRTNEIYGKMAGQSPSCREGCKAHPSDYDADKSQPPVYGNAGVVIGHAPISPGSEKRKWAYLDCSGGCNKTLLTDSISWCCYDCLMANRMCSQCAYTYEDHHIDAKLRGLSCGLFRTLAQR
jgi:hypothetical protein